MFLLLQREKYEDNKMDLKVDKLSNKQQNEKLNTTLNKFKTSESETIFFDLNTDRSYNIDDFSNVLKLAKNDKFSSIYDENSEELKKELLSIYDVNDDKSIDELDIQTIGISISSKTKIFEILNSIIKNKNNKKDLVDIDENIDNSKQGKRGDCWLLSGLNSLSYSENGQKIIEDSISVNEDGSYNVEFKGLNSNINITTEELEKARKEGSYSTGDDDVLLMELAFEKALQLVEDGEIDAPDWLIEETKNGETSIDGGTLEVVIFMLTGEEAEYQYNCYHPDYDGSINAEIQRLLPGLAGLFNNSMESVFDKIEKNPEGYCAIIGFRGQKGTADDEAITIKDINGNDVVLTHGDGGHAWSIKSVDGDNVVIVNPWDSSVEITVSKEELLKYATGIEYYEFNK